MITTKSNYSVTETLDRLADAITNAGGKVFARVNHTAGAESIGETLRPTEAIIFGNPKIGTPTMQAAQTMGLDLPLRALAWEDENGQVFFTYHDPKAVGAEHGLTEDTPVLEQMTKVMQKMTKVATE